MAFDDGIDGSSPPTEYDLDCFSPCTDCRLGEVILETGSPHCGCLGAPSFADEMAEVERDFGAPMARIGQFAGGPGIGSKDTEQLGGRSSTSTVPVGGIG